MRVEVVYSAYAYWDIIDIVHESSAIIGYRHATMCN